MNIDLELAYLGLEVADPTAFGEFLANVVGLVPGERTSDGATTWRDDDRVHRVLVTEGPANDASFIGFEATSRDAYERAVERARRALAGLHGLERHAVEHFVLARHAAGLFDTRVADRAGGVHGVDHDHGAETTTTAGYVDPATRGGHHRSTDGGSEIETAVTPARPQCARVAEPRGDAVPTGDGDGPTRRGQRRCLGTVAAGGATGRRTGTCTGTASPGFVASTWVDHVW